eukprot:6213681-Pleurochrysis_carterae.AAC.1
MAPARIRLGEGLRGARRQPKFVAAVPVKTLVFKRAGSSANPSFDPFVYAGNRGNLRKVRLSATSAIVLSKKKFVPETSK